MITGSRKDALFISTNILSKVKSTHNAHQKSKALQAYSYNRHFSFLLSNALRCIKRASFRLSVKCAASVSIEASIAIPIFMFCFLEILSLINYLSVYSGILYAMKSAAEPIAVYSYAYEELKDADEEILIGEETVSALIFSEAYLDTQIRKMCDSNLYKNTIKGGSKGINLLGSHVDYEKSCVDVIAYYTVKPLIPFSGTELFMMNRYYTKLWTGYKLESDLIPDTYVYITENGSVYHLEEDCTHLKLSVSRVNTEELHNMRNDSGGKYLECSKCCEDGAVKEVYYITKQGDRYHENINCSGLKRTVYCVEREDVSDLPVCSRCSQEIGEEN